MDACVFAIRLLEYFTWALNAVSVPYASQHSCTQFSERTFLAIILSIPIKIVWVIDAIVYLVIWMLTASSGRNLCAHKYYPVESCSLFNQLHIYLVFRHLISTAIDSLDSCVQITTSTKCNTVIFFSLLITYICEYWALWVFTTFRNDDLYKQFSYTMIDYDYVR